MAGLAGGLSGCTTHEATDTGNESVVSASTVPAGDLVTGQAELGFALYAKLTEDAGAPENLFISPVSISTAFGLLHAGANGTTADEIAAVMRFPVDVDAQMRGFAESVSDDREGSVFALANAVFAAEALPISESYRATVEEAYGGKVERVPFATAPRQAEATINAWVSENTRGLIPKVYEGTVQDDWILSLVNTAYLKADWENQFDASLTSPQEFAAPDGPVEVEMMRDRRNTPFAEGRGWKAVKLPYLNGTMSATFVLPMRGGLATLERGMDAQWLAEVEGALNASKAELPYVDLEIPKVDVAGDYELTGVLQAMDLVEIFGSPDLDRIYGQEIRNDQVSSVIHKTRLKVDEKGTEAAAVTAIGIHTTSARIEPEAMEFHADQPFLLLLRHEETGAVLFMGRIADPTG